MIKILMIGPGASKKDQIGAKGGVNKIYSSMCEALKKVEEIELNTFDILSVKTNPVNILSLAKNVSKADLIHIHCSFHTLVHSYQLLLPLIFSKIFGKISIVSYHTGYDEKFVSEARTYLRLMFGFCDLVIVPSEHSKNYLIKNRIVQKRHVTVLPNFIDDEFLSLESKNSKDIDVVTVVAELDQETYLTKGIDRFIQVSKRFPYLTFAIVGRVSDGKLKNSIEKEGDVLLLGYLDKDELLDVLRKSRIYLQLSRRESFGIAVLEAMSQGVVPIVSDVGALPEVVGDSGVVVEGGDKNQVADVLRDLMNDPKQSSDPIKRIRDEYTLTSHINRYMDLIRKMYY